MAMAWIDYLRYYDSVPHSLKLRTMVLDGFNMKIIRLIDESMKKWNTQLTACGTRLANIPIKSGIFQGDAPSPLLFSVALNPLSTILHQATFGYKLKKLAETHPLGMHG